MKSTESGEISQDACYTLSELQKRTGLKRDAMRSARKNGLRVIYRHNRAFIMGSDFLSYLAKEETSVRS